MKIIIMIRSVSEYANWRAICGFNVLRIGLDQISWLSVSVLFTWDDEVLDVPESWCI